MIGREIWDPIGASEFNPCYQPRVAVAECACDRCHALRRCIVFDSSSGEYEPLQLCLLCLAELAEYARRIVLP